MDSLVDPGISGSGNRATDYWPETSSGSSWYERSNWFRVKHREQQTQPETQPAAAPVRAPLSLSPSAIDSNTTVVEYGGIPDSDPPKFLVNIHKQKEKEREELSNAPGYASAFNRFITNNKSADTYTAPETVAANAAAATQAAAKTNPSKLGVRQARIRLSAIRGYGAEVMKKIHEFIVLPLCHPGLYKGLGIRPARGLLLSGIAGSGKTALVRSIADSLGIYFQHVDGTNLLASTGKESKTPHLTADAKSSNSSAAGPENPEEHLLEAIFRVSVKNAPAILFIDELDSICLARNISESAHMTKVRGILRKELDKLAASSVPLLVVGATNCPEMIDPSLLKSGRFEKHIALNKPDKPSRLQLLKEFTKGMKLHSDVLFERLADETVGFVGSDLQSLCTEAGLECIREKLKAQAAEFRSNQSGDSDNDMEDSELYIPMSLDPALLDSLFISQRHFDYALTQIKPSAAREFQLDIPQVKWSDIGGVEDVKSNLIETVEYPMKFRSLFSKFGLMASSGVLLYGPSGCGKTLLAKAIATQSGASFMSVKGPEILSAYLGESEKKVRELFAKARAASPCVIFFDEIDAIAGARGNGSDSTIDRVLNQLLTEFDSRTEGGKKGEEVIVFVVAATNRPETIDPALMRPGRLDQLIFIGLPNEEGRLGILKSILADTPVEEAIKANDYEFLSSLAARTERLSGADLSGIVNNARRMAIREDLAMSSSGQSSAGVVTMAHFEKALADVQPSVSDDELERFRWFNAMMKGQSRSTRDEKSEEETDEDMETGESLNQLRQKIQDRVIRDVERGASPQDALNKILSAFRAGAANERKEDVEMDDEKSDNQERKISGMTARS